MPQIRGFHPWLPDLRENQIVRTDQFLVARNPDPDSRLPYLLRIPVEGGIVLKTRDTWPRSSRLYCHLSEAQWDDTLDVVEQVDVVTCRRRGAAIDLVLDRPRLQRSQFVFTEARGRPAIFWQTRIAARKANPGARVPKGRTVPDISIVIDTRERYGFKFTSRNVATERAALPAGDYGVMDGGDVVAVVERKTLEDFAGSLSNGTFGFQVQKLSEFPLAAVVIEGNYPDLFRLHSGRGSWIADLMSRLAVRYPEVQVMFAGNKKFAEEWTYRFLVSALEDLSAL